MTELKAVPAGQPGIQGSTPMRIPLSYLDNSAAHRQMNIHVLFIYQEILDPERLRCGLESLIKRHGWERLGGRLSRNASSEIELRIPQHFDSSCPPISYCTLAHSMSFAKDYASSVFPVSDMEPTIGPDAAIYSPLMYPGKYPKRLKDYLDSNSPVLGLRIEVFKDATTVSLYWPHVVCDIIGINDVLSAWSMVLDGREDDVSIPTSSNPHPLLKLGQDSVTPYHLRDSQLSFAQLALFWIKNLPAIFLADKQRRVVCIPQGFIQRLRSSITDEGISGSQHAKESFLSDGDILSAWWARLVVSCTSKTRISKRTIVLLNARSLRSDSVAGLLPRDSVFIANAVDSIPVLLDADCVQSVSICQTAMRIRHAISLSQDPEQIKAYASLWRSNWKHLNPLFGNSGMRVISVSNWSKARLYDKEFPASVEIHPHKSLDATSVRPAYIQGYVSGPKYVDVAIITGKDSKNNYWLDCNLDRRSWRMAKSMIAQM